MITNLKAGTIIHPMQNAIINGRNSSIVFMLVWWRSNRVELLFNVNQNIHNRAQFRRTVKVSLAPFKLVLNKIIEQFMLFFVQNDCLAKAKTFGLAGEFRKCGHEKKVTDFL